MVYTAFGAWAQTNAKSKNLAPLLKQWGDVIYVIQNVRLWDAVDGQASMCLAHCRRVRGIGVREVVPRVLAVEPGLHETGSKTQPKTNTKNTTKTKTTTTTNTTKTTNNDKNNDNDNEKKNAHGQHFQYFTVDAWKNTHARRDYAI